MKKKSTGSVWDYKKAELRPLSIAIASWLGNTTTGYGPTVWSEEWQLKRIVMKKSQLERRDCVFVSRINLEQCPGSRERLTVLKNCEYDAETQGYWIKRASTAHSLALLLGLDPYDRNQYQGTGRWNRSGRIL